MHISNYVLNTSKMSDIPKLSKIFVNGQPCINKHRLFINVIAMCSVYENENKLICFNDMLHKQNKNEGVMFFWLSVSLG
jgi:hypothetical protein